MFNVGDRVRIHRPLTILDGATGEVVQVRDLPPSPRGGIRLLSRLYTVRLDDGTLVEQPLAVSDLGRVERQ